MPTTESRKSYKNRVLASLPKAEIDRLALHLFPVTLEVNKTLLGASEKISDAYFLEEGLASIVVSMSNGSTVEVGVVGRDGMSGLPLLLGTDSIPSRTFMQISGSGFRIKAKRLLEEYAKPGKLRNLLQNYLQSHLVQTSQAAACNRLHEAEQRLAKWLLICRDRTGSDHLPLTHEFLAQMLGTRRSTVTLAAGILHRAGLIEYSRGHVTILNGEGLKDVACECYRTIRDESRRLRVL
jgi:CRP-like cAMP-binding protein